MVPLLTCIHHSSRRQESSIVRDISPLFSPRSVCPILIPFKKKANLLNLTIIICSKQTSPPRLKLTLMYHHHHRAKIVGMSRRLLWTSSSSLVVGVGRTASITTTRVAPVAAARRVRMGRIVLQGRSLATGTSKTTTSTVSTSDKDSNAADDKITKSSSSTSSSAAAASSSASSSASLCSFARLRQVSNIASILCAMDCTIMPVITVALPLVGILDLEPQQMQALHHLSHQLALYFVLPIGTLTTALNYQDHRHKGITSLGVAGLGTIGLANSSWAASALTTVVDPFFFSNTAGGFDTIVQALQQHDSAMHRVANTLGCAGLLSSNYLSQQRGCSHHHHHHGSGCCSVPSHKSHQQQDTSHQH